MVRSMMVVVNRYGKGVFFGVFFFDTCTYHHAPYHYPPSLPFTLFLRGCFRGQEGGICWVCVCPFSLHLKVLTSLLPLPSTKTPSTTAGGRCLLLPSLHHRFCAYLPTCLKDKQVGRQGRATFVLRLTSGTWIVWKCKAKWRGVMMMVVKERKEGREKELLVNLMMYYILVRERQDRHRFAL